MKVKMYGNLIGNELIVMGIENIFESESAAD